MSESAVLIHKFLCFWVKGFHSLSLHFLVYLGREIAIKFIERSFVKMLRRSSILSVHSLNLLYLFNRRKDRRKTRRFTFFLESQIRKASLQIFTLIMIIRFIAMKAYNRMIESW